MTAAQRAHELAHQQAPPRPSDLAVSAAHMVRREIASRGLADSHTIVFAALAGYLPQAASDAEAGQIARTVLAATDAATSSNLAVGRTLPLDDPCNLYDAWIARGAQPHLWITDSSVPPGLCCVCGRPKDSDAHPWDRPRPVAGAVVNGHQVVIALTDPIITCPDGDTPTTRYQADSGYCPCCDAWVLQCQEPDRDDEDGDR